MSQNIKHENGEKSRGRIGKTAGIIGILCNLFLCVTKITVGTISASTAVIADGLNNLSDMAASVITLLGFKLSEKPADKNHPFGHARYEYLVSLTVSMLILVIGFELGKASVQKIINPAPVVISPVLLAVLILSVIVKGVMTITYGRLGKKIDSTALLTVSADNRNDVITTAAVLAAALIEHYTKWRIDGYAGLLVSVFILLNGISLAKETISILLGKAAPPELQKEITDYICSETTVIGCHDLLVHDYGPENRFATIHVEMDKEMSPIECHEIIDKLERGCLERFGTHLVIHYDPVMTDDPETNRLKATVTSLLKMRDERLEIHDFRVMKKEDQTELFFDMVVPEELSKETHTLKSSLEKALSRTDGKKYVTHITFDL